MKKEDLPPNIYVIDPNGEKRPLCPSANAVHQMKRALGIPEDEYVEVKPKDTKEKAEEKDS
ncbi:MAG: hypothetical protein OXH31_00430 [Gammaproteobacteria bacterium]|nr:hypothetical protein [Gammaproteobacteria bacterium]